MGGFAQAGIQIGAGAAQGASVGGPIGAGVGAATAAAKVAISDLIQHSARLKQAKSENAGIPPVVAAFDADFQAIVTAYNNAQATASQCITALQTLDANIQANLKANIAGPNGAVIAGSSWNSTTGLAGKCDKTCTAGCCVYYGALGPPISVAQIAMGGSGGLWGRTDPRLALTSTGGTVTCPEVFASKYGGADRPGYAVTISTPPGIGQVQAGITSTVNELLGNTPSVIAGLAPGVSSINPIYLVIGVAFVFIGIIVAVFSGKS